MRIVGGSLKGRRLAGPRTNAIRPTTDGNRERLFNILEHSDHKTTPWGSTVVIDLFAGTGALGLEALSRGAASALFVDNSIEGRGLIRENIEALGVAARARLFKRDASKLGARGKLDPADLGFLDPPYGQGLGEKVLIALDQGAWLKADALVIVEEASTVALDAPKAFTLLENRRAGDAQLAFFRYHPAP